MLPPRTFSLADKLTPGAACAGKPYFISNDEPLPVFELINKILAACRSATGHAIDPGASGRGWRAG